jgi:hypothetical protein
MVVVSMLMSPLLRLVKSVDSGVLAMVALVVVAVVSVIVDLVIAVSAIVVVIAAMDLVVEIVTELLLLSASLSTLLRVLSLWTLTQPPPLLPRENRSILGPILSVVLLRIGQRWIKLLLSV